MAANCDKFGVLYSLHFSAPRQNIRRILGDIEGNGLSVAPALTDDINVTINVNGVIAKNIPLTNLVQETLNNACATSDYICACDYTAGIWAFIENESDWAFIFTVEAHVLEIDYDWLMSVVNTPDPSTDAGHNDWRDSAWELALTREYDIGKCFFFDSGNTQKKIGEWQLTYRRVFDPENDLVFRLSAANSDFSEIIGLALPIQDGYYFSIDSLTPPESLSLPKFALHSLFSPTGNKILTAEFPIGTRFAICKLNSSRFLLSAQPTYFSFVSELANWESERYSHANLGLFFLEDNELQRVSDSEDFSLYCLNQRLRPMKRYKNCWDNIQTL